jgi:hypothetical protein
VLAALALTNVASADDVAVAASFSRQEVEIIARFYREHAATPAPGSSSTRLPRGIAKKLARGKPMPPGIAKRALPQDLTILLPPPPVGHERIVVAGKILLVDIATQVVRDVLTDVLFR